MAFMLTEEQTVDAILFKIQQWDGWIAIQKGAAKEYSMPEQEFYLILPEYQKFMGLLALGYRGIGMWSQKVDVIWHAHILNTQRYENFCRTIIGEMVHHVPCCDMQRIEPGLSCGEPEPEPSCAEPDPEPSCREPDPGPSCKVITFFRTIFPAKTSQGENETSHSPLSRKRSLLAPLELGLLGPLTR